MKRSTRIAALIVAIVAGSAANPAAAWSRPAQHREGADKLDDARERWKQLAPEKREELRRRFDEFKRLRDDQREQLRGRFERLGLVKQRAMEALPDAARRELDSLPPPQRGEVLREVAAERVSEHGRAVLELMPEHVRREYEAADGELKREIAARFARQLHERARHELTRLGRELEMGPEDVAAIARLEPHELGRRVLELKRLAIERTIDERGLPPFVSAAQWQELERLEGPEFFRRWAELHQTDPQMGRPGPGRGFAGGGPGQDERFHGLGVEGPRSRPGAGPGVRPAPGDPRARPGGGARQPSGALGPDTRKRIERLSAMRDAVRPDPEWFVELSRLDPQERRQRIAERLRERALEFLKDAPELVPREELEKLRKESGPRFHDQLRRLLPDLGQPPVLRERGGPPPHRPSGPPQRGRPPR